MADDTRKPEGIGEAAGRFSDEDEGQTDAAIGQDAGRMTTHPDEADLSGGVTLGGAAAGTISTGQGAVAHQRLDDEANDDTKGS